MPQNCSTICIVGNTINHGEGGRRGIWEVGGKGTPSWISVTYHWEAHLWGEPRTGLGVQHKARVPGWWVRKEGRARVWRSVLHGRRSDLPHQDQCVPPWGLWTPG